MEAKSNNSYIEKYTYRIEWSDFEKKHLAKCLEFPSLYSLGDTIEQALGNIKKSVKDVVEQKEEKTEEIPQPFGLKRYRGHLTVRVPPEKHRELVIKSAEEGISINQYILSRLG